MLEYEQRDMVLAKMGFTSYPEYLASKLWQKIRKRAMAETEGKCSLCSEPATEVHHKDYSEETLSGADLSKLFPLCSACHEIGEFDELGRKVPLWKANERMRLLASLPAAPPNHDQEKKKRQQLKAQARMAARIGNAAFCQVCLVNMVNKNGICKRCFKEEPMKPKDQTLPTWTAGASHTGFVNLDRKVSGTAP